MKLKTASSVQWTATVILAVVFSPLFIVFKAMEYLRSKALDAFYSFVQYIGNHLLLHTDEYKSGIFKNPKVKDMTAMQVWHQLKQERSDLTDEDRD